MYERSESSMEFIKKTLDLNAKVGTFVVKMPPKYKMLYGDDMAKTGLAALRMLQTGNGIFVSKDTTPAVFEERLKLFETARGYIYNLPTTLRLCNKIRLDIEKPDAQTKEKWIWQAKELCELCNECITLITGVIRTDRRRYKEYVGKN